VTVVSQLVLTLVLYISVLLTVHCVLISVFNVYMIMITVQNNKMSEFERKEEEEEEEGKEKEEKEEGADKRASFSEPSTKDPDIEEWEDYKARQQISRHQSPSFETDKSSSVSDTEYEGESDFDLQDSDAEEVNWKERCAHAAAWEAATKGGFDELNERWQDVNVYEPEEEFARVTNMKLELESQLRDLTAKKEDVDLQLQNLNTVKDEVELKLANMMAVKDDVDSELVALKRKHDDLDGELCALDTQVSANKRIRLTDDPSAKILFACEICCMIQIYMCQICL
jgi:hypothetical protein